MGGEPQGAEVPGEKSGRVKPPAAGRWVFAVESFPKNLGGAHKAILALARALAAAGRPVRILAQSGEGSWDGIRVEEGCFPLVGKRNPEERVISFFAAASPFPDLYYPHGGSWKSWERQNRICAEGAYRWLQAVRVKLSPKQRAGARDEAQILLGSRSPEVVAISKGVADAIANDYGVPRGRIHLVYNGVDTEMYRPDNALRERVRRERGWDRAFVCLFAAHNFRLKGLANAVTAAGILGARREVRWIIAGKDKPGRYAALARRLGCGERLEFLGAVGDLRPLYAAADLLVQPTFYDPCSLTSLEALACGLPVLTSRWNGVSEILREAGGGRVVDDPRDAAGLAAAVEEMAADGPEAQARRRTARAAAERHSEKVWVADMIRVMDGVAGISS